jgi:catechol 2,3-dioxygenase-like lactoylglutathione lyase family enzyme
VATIDHVTLRVSDLDGSRELFARVFELLDFRGERSEGGGFLEWNDFSIAAADAAHPPTRNVHIGFAATSRPQIDRWWQGLTAAGYPDDGPPGPRPEYGRDYYGAFIRDRDDNSIEAVHHKTARPETGLIDHLWIRVRDLDASRRFYTAIAAAVGIPARDLGGRLQLIGERGTCSFLAGPPTENLHLAFGVADRDTVRAFHAAGLRAGGRDNGPPGERPRYHPGYYGAYLLDPNGHNVEAVYHGRAA